MHVASMGACGVLEGEVLGDRWCMARQPSSEGAPGSHPNLESFNPFPADGESLRQPRLYMDLRPYIDCGPITVR